MQIYCIFDQDGTLIDSMKYHKESWIDVCLKYGSRNDRQEIGKIHDENVKGLTGAKKVSKLIEIGLVDPVPEPQLALIAEEKEDIYDSLVYENVKEIPGAFNFLEQLSKRDVSIALATSARKDPATKILNKLGINHYFQAKVFREDVMEGKPNPESYLTAGRLISAVPSNTFVFEDSKPGFQGASQTPYMLVSIGMKPELLEKYKPVINIPDFKNISFENLESLIS